MTHASITALRSAIVAPPSKDPKWAAKMLQFVPDLPTVPDRMAYLVAKATGRVVLDLGCTGPISQKIRAAAKQYYGVDKEPGPDRIPIDLDATPELLIRIPDVEVVIASEILEHLSNPGRFLTALRDAYPGREVYLTAPHAGAYAVKDGTHEVVNRDHVAWYSYTTLTTLLERSGYVIQAARWYHGDPHKAEGLIMVVK